MVTSTSSQFFLHNVYTVLLPNLPDLFLVVWSKHRERMWESAKFMNTN